MLLKGIEKVLICCFYLIQIFFIVGIVIKNNLFYCILKRLYEVYIMIYFKDDSRIKIIVKMQYLK